MVSRIIFKDGYYVPQRQWKFLWYKYWIPFESKFTGVGYYRDKSFTAAYSHLEFLIKKQASGRMR